MKVILNTIFQKYKSNFCRQKLRLTHNNKHNFKLLQLSEINFEVWSNTSVWSEEYCVLQSYLDWWGGGVGEIRCPSDMHRPIRLPQAGFRPNDQRTRLVQTSTVCALHNQYTMVKKLKY